MDNQAQPATREALPASMRYALGSTDAVSSSTVERMFESNNGNVFGPSSSNEIRSSTQS